MVERELSDAEYARIQRWLYDTAGISLGAGKKALVCGRLAKRLAALDCDSYGDYFDLIENKAHAAERQTALDLLTTNETYFFREPKHFAFLTEQIIAKLERGRTLRVWSAACSSGEEPYTLAILLSEKLGEGMWEILASDISSRVLAKARNGVYPMERARDVPSAYLHKYFLRGTGPHVEQVMVAKSLRRRVQFLQVNLNAALPAMGEFDVVFLRNVMIYFDNPTKAAVVHRIASVLKPGGHLLIGHSESLNGIYDGLQCVRPSVYQKPTLSTASRQARTG